MRSRALFLTDTLPIVGQRRNEDFPNKARDVERNQRAWICFWQNLNSRPSISKVFDLENVAEAPFFNI